MGSAQSISKIFGSTKTISKAPEAELKANLPFGELLVSKGLISREELKEKLDRGDDFKLVMVLGEWHFRAMHIPKSINVDTPEAAVQVLDPGDDIVVYCSGEACLASRVAYKKLEDNGYKNVRRFAGGISDWTEAGYPLEGEWAANV